MIEKEELRKLIKYIEENLRASKSGGLKFIDPRNYKSRLKSSQNHIIYGRRGAGKSTLISSTDLADDVVSILINLEDYKDITFPNIIIQTLISCFYKLEEKIRIKYPFYKLNINSLKLRKKIKIEINALKSLLVQPDFEKKEIKTKETKENGISDGAKAGLSYKGTRGEIRSEKSTKIATEEEISRSVYIDKLNTLKTKLPAYKFFIQAASKTMNNNPIFLSLDDFYFIPKSIQPDYIDYLHRLSKDSELYLKVATIKHRSRIYKQTDESYVGVEPEHDIYTIDMDYTLDNFSDLQSFMHGLLENALNYSEADIDINELFTGDGLSQLCLASGGVPRDFLALFVKLSNLIVAGTIRSIGKVSVTEEAINNINNKMSSMRTDSAEERDVLEKYLHFIKNTIYNQKRTNAFLVAKNDLDQFPQERQAIKELIDLRFFHLVDGNTSSAPSDGRRYEAYIIDLGLYDNARPRNFSQIEPGTRDDKSRRDDMRSSPRLSLHEMQSSIGKLGGFEKLKLSSN